MTSTNGYDGSYAAISGNNGENRATDNFVNAALQCEKPGIAARVRKPVAFVETPGVIAGFPGEDLCANGAAGLGGAAGMNHRTAVYVIRMPGGVGGRSRKASSYPD